MSRSVCVSQSENRRTRLDNADGYLRLGLGSGFAMGDAEVAGWGILSPLVERREEARDTRHAPSSVHHPPTTKQPTKTGPKHLITTARQPKWKARRVYAARVSVVSSLACVTGASYAAHCQPVSQR